MATKPARSDAFDSILQKVRTDSPAGNVRQLPLSQIQPNPQQPRKHFPPEQLAALAESARKRGILQPILVRPVGDGYEIIAGERRYRASLEAGLLSIPAVVQEADDVLARELALIENLNRQDLNPIEETRATLELLSLTLEKTRENVIEILRAGYYRAQGRKSVNTGIYSGDIERADHIFERLGRTSLPSFYTNRLPLLSLTEDLQNLVSSGQLDYSKAKLLGNVTPPERQAELIERTISENLTRSDLQSLVQGNASTATPSDIDLGTLKRKLTPQTLEALKPAKQKRIQKLLNQIEMLLRD